MAELFTALESSLPFAQVEVNCVADDARDLPDDPETVERTRRGQDAIETAKRLIARKTVAIRRKQRAFTEHTGQADA
jgi:hypothetical protein